MNTEKLFPMLAIAALLSACAAPMRNASVFGDSGRMQPEAVRFGTILAVHAIRIRRSALDEGRGAVAGGVGGGGLGAAISGTKGAIMGALAGIGVGSAVGSRETVPGQLLTIRLASGIVAFPQPLAKNERPFVKGERVEVLEGRHFDRVLPVN